MPKFVFVIGSSGTGKSTLSKEMANIINDKGLSVSILHLDHYYLPKAMLDPNKPKNFDIPAALEEDLIRTHLADLEAGKSIQRPTYCMVASDRIAGGEEIFAPTDVIIVEGIFAGEYTKNLKKSTEKLKVTVQALHVPDNYSRKEERDKNERQKSEAHIKAMKRNQIGCLFAYIAPHMNSSDFVVENTWQPGSANRPMITGDKLFLVTKFLGTEGAISQDLNPDQTKLFV